jgi:hypothetical protein
MAIDADQIRTLIEEKLFTPYGLDATWEQKNSATNEWGEKTNSSYDTGQTIQIIPYNTLSTIMTYERMGNFEAGDTEAAVRYGVSVSQDDRISFGGNTYEVREIEDNYLQKNLVKIVRLARVS